MTATINYVAVASALKITPDRAQAIAAELEKTGIQPTENAIAEVVQIQRSKTATSYAAAVKAYAQSTAANNGTNEDIQKRKDQGAQNIGHAMLEAMANPTAKAMADVVNAMTVKKTMALILTGEASGEKTQEALKDAMKAGKAMAAGIQAAGSRMLQALDEELDEEIDASLALGGNNFLSLPFAENSENSDYSPSSASTSTNGNGNGSN